jgi:hypothetical protein
MKKLILALVVFAATYTVKAQDKNFTLGAGVNLAMPIGDFGDAAGFGFGPRVQAELGLSDNLKGIASISYNFFSEKDNSGVKTNVLPIQVGARYYVGTEGGFFIGAELGYANLTQKIDVLGSSISSSTGGFAYNPHVGYDLEKVQFALNYQAISKSGTLSFLALSAIYKF